MEDPLTHGIIVLSCPVFILLQTVYQAFDAIAKKYKVFKVETIGDQYVAVTGLPEPQERHAVLMARFAQDCNDKMTELVQRLEVSLGPDTADLAMRFGMNSGRKSLIQKIAKRLLVPTTLTDFSLLIVSPQLLLPEF